MSTRNSNTTTSVLAWARAYGLDLRQARRLRRKVARTGEQPCPYRGCLLLVHRSRLHYLADHGPVLS